MKRPVGLTISYTLSDTHPKSKGMSKMIAGDVATLWRSWGKRPSHHSFTNILSMSYCLSSVKNLGLSFRITSYILEHHTINCSALSSCIWFMSPSRYGPLDIGVVPTFSDNTNDKPENPWRPMEVQLRMQLNLLHYRLKLGNFCYCPSRPSSR